MWGTLLAFSDVRRNIIRSDSNVRCWINVAPLIWIVLSIGWSVVLISIIISFQVPSSGAVLVCAAVIAEVVFERLSFRRWRQVDDHGRSSVFGLVEDSEKRLGLGDDNTLLIGKADGFGRNIQALLGLSLDDEWKKQHNVKDRSTQGAFWVYSDTINRVETLLTTYIIISVIFGTLIWGYAHCLYQSCIGPIGGIVH